MRYMTPEKKPQREVIAPYQIIGGNLPGNTQIRINGRAGEGAIDIKKDGIIVKAGTTPRIVIGNAASS